MPLEEMEVIEVRVTRAYLFYLLVTTLFTNHGTDVDLILLPPLLTRLCPSIDGNLTIGEEDITAEEVGAAPSQQQRGLPVQGMLDTHAVSPYRMTLPSYSHVSIEDYNEVNQLFEAVRFNLAVVRLFDEHISSQHDAERPGVGMPMEEELTKGE
ncbi:hypothetical protein JCGZ_19110 [Jatropha curcas]|uniref:Uncharacterized protein n=1 Tax=Jatropha curcas TaxID=180498 RepID=A0A067KCJ5_JATCU|nr:hypothetical protein JCGZ_19110 [Jatropha curcas]